MSESNVVDVHVHWIDPDSPVLNPAHPDEVMTFVSSDETNDSVTLRDDNGNDFIIDPPRDLLGNPVLAVVGFVF
jgi:hypothetical protein